MDDHAELIMNVTSTPVACNLSMGFQCLNCPHVIVYICFFFAQILELPETLCHIPHELSWAAAADDAPVSAEHGLQR